MCRVCSLLLAAYALTHSRLVGFEDLGNDDKFETATLEWRLLNSGEFTLCLCLNAA